MEIWPLLITSVITGLLGGVHCLGMCGGIVAALHSRPSALTPALPATNFPVPVVAAPNTALPTPGVNAAQKNVALPSWAAQLGYNAGRLSSYTLAGALFGTLSGGLGSAAWWLGSVRPLQHAGYLVTNFFLIALGLYLAGGLPVFARIEALGRGLWRRLAPRAAHALAAPNKTSFSQAWLTGALWGWVPCGLVYSTLLVAMISGSARNGALVLLAFGIGTLPTLLAAGFAAQQLRAWLARRGVRWAAGALVLSFGLLGLWRAHLLVQQQGGWFCLT